MLRVLFGFAVLVLSGAVPAQPWDGPFGLKMGLTKAQIESAVGKLERLDDRLYTLQTPPKHYPGFDFYAVLIGHNAGLCELTAVASIKSPPSGDTVKSRFADIKNDVIKKYDLPITNTDFLNVESILDKPQDWMLSLAKRQRVFSSIWLFAEDDKGQLKFPNDIISIKLEAVGRSSTEAYIELDYVFSNRDSCVKEIESGNADAL